MKPFPARYQAKNGNISSSKLRRIPCVCRFSSEQAHERAKAFPREDRRVRASFIVDGPYRGEIIEREREVATRLPIAKR